MPNMSESLASWRTSDRERRQDLVWSDLALVPYHALAPAPALFTSLPGAGAIGEISQASIPHDLSHTHRISRGLEARRCLPWHPATTTTGARKDLETAPPLPAETLPRPTRPKNRSRESMKSPNPKNNTARHKNGQNRAHKLIPPYHCSPDISERKRDLVST